MLVFCDCHAWQTVLLESLSRIPAAPTVAFQTTPKQLRFQSRMKKTKTKDQNLKFGMAKLMILIQKMARTLINEPKTMLTLVLLLMMRRKKIRRSSSGQLTVTKHLLWHSVESNTCRGSWGPLIADFSPVAANR
ncbi:hypothetical protein AKJ16_DCAP14372 [Drosera capensis]